MILSRPRAERLCVSHQRSPVFCQKGKRLLAAANSLFARITGSQPPRPSLVWYPPRAGAAPRRPPARRMPSRAPRYRGPHSQRLRRRGRRFAPPPTVTRFGRPSAPLVVSLPHSFSPGIRVGYGAGNAYRGLGCRGARAGPGDPATDPHSGIRDSLPSHGRSNRLARVRRGLTPAGPAASPRRSVPRTALRLARRPARPCRTTRAGPPSARAGPPSGSFNSGKNCLSVVK